MALHRSFTGVVGRQGQGQIAVVAPQQVAQMPRASIEVLGRVVQVGNAITARGIRHELHQPGRSLPG